jgi:hypothetical protein
MSIAVEREPRERGSAHDALAICLFERLMRGLDGAAGLRQRNDTLARQPKQGTTHDRHQHL